MAVELTTWSDPQSTSSPVERIAFSYLYMTSGQGGFLSKIVLLPFRLIMIAVILLGNATTVIAICKYRRLQTKTNLILCSLGVSDTCNGFTMFGFMVRYFIMPAPLSSNINIHDLLCLLELIPIAISLCHLVAIAIDRYVAIIWPLHYSQYVDEKVVVGLIVSSWITGIVTVSSYGWWYINWDSTTGISPIPAVFDYIIKCGFQAVMMPILLALYVQIFKVSRQQRRKIHAMDIHTSSQESSDKEKKLKEKMKEYKATVLTLVVSVMATVLWSPYFITITCMYLGFMTSVTGTALQMSIGLGMCNSAVNFFIYALMNTELRLAFAKIWGIKIRPPNGHGESSLNGSFN